MSGKLTSEQIASQLQKLGHEWHHDNGYLVKRIEFSSFGEAIHFINHLSDIAEKEEHHPDLHLTNYSHLEIRLTTHDAKGITENDFSLAQKISDLIAKEV